ncbi:MAG: FMN-binding negative transcriptional regulator [Planktomarina sp.]
MHPNPIFRSTTTPDDIAFMRHRSFGVLSIHAAPLFAHIPFYMADDGTYIEAHLVRSNPILKHLDTPQPATLIVSGGDAYVSPDWYGVEDQVPTWNYIALHAVGQLERLEDDALHGVLERLSQHMETQIKDKKPWVIDKMTPDAYARMARQIVPVRLTIEDIQSTWKLSQNKPQNVRDGAMAGMQGNPIGMNVDQILSEMTRKKD